MKISLLYLAVGVCAALGATLSDAQSLDLPELRRLLKERRGVPQAEQWETGSRVGPSQIDPDSSYPQQRAFDQPDEDEEQSLEEWQNDEERSFDESSQDDEDLPDSQQFSDKHSSEEESLQERYDIPEPYDENSRLDNDDKEQQEEDQRYFEEPEERELGPQQASNFLDTSYLDESDDVEPEARSVEDESYSEEAAEEPELRPQQLPKLDQPAPNDFIDPDQTEDDSIQEEERKSLYKEKPRKPKKPAKGKSLKELSKLKVVSASRYNALTISFSGRTYRISGVLVTVPDGDASETSQYFLRRTYKRTKWYRWRWVTSVRKVKQVGKLWQLAETKKIAKSTFGDFLKATDYTRSSASAAAKMMKLE